MGAPICIEVLPYIANPYFRVLEYFLPSTGIALGFPPLFFIVYLKNHAEHLAWEVGEGPQIVTGPRDVSDPGEHLRRTYLNRLCYYHFIQKAASTVVQPMQTRESAEYWCYR